MRKITKIKRKLNEESIKKELKRNRSSGKRKRVGSLGLGFQQEASYFKGATTRLNEKKPPKEAKKE